MLGPCPVDSVAKTSFCCRIRLIGRGPEADHRQLPYALQLPGLNDPSNVAAKRANYFPGLYGNVVSLSPPVVIYKEVCLHRSCSVGWAFPDGRNST